MRQRDSNPRPRCAKASAPLPSFFLFLRMANVGIEPATSSRPSSCTTVPDEKSSANRRCAKKFSKMPICRTSVQLILSYLILSLSYLILSIAYLISDFFAVILVFIYSSPSAVEGGGVAAVSGQSVSCSFWVSVAPHRPNQRLCGIGLIFLHPLMHSLVSTPGNGRFSLSDKRSYLGVDRLPNCSVSSYALSHTDDGSWCQTCM